MKGTTTWRKREDLGYRCTAREEEDQVHLGGFRGKKKRVGKTGVDFEGTKSKTPKSRGV